MNKTSLFLLAASLHFLPGLRAVGPSTADAAPAPAPAPADSPYKAGDPAPAALLAAPALRGEPPQAFTPGVVHVITIWNTVGGHPFAPGYNIVRPMSTLAPTVPVRGLVAMLPDDIPKEKLEKRLARPSQRTPYPIMRVAPGSDAGRAYAKLDGGNNNTLVVRDGRILWVGGGQDLDPAALAEFAAPEFDYDRYVVVKAARDARTKELLALFVKGLPAARKAGDAARAEEILNTLENEPGLHPFLFQRLRDTRCFMAVDRGDIPGALAEMRRLSDKYPADAGTQSWVHKIVTGTEALNKPGAGLAALAASRAARLKTGEVASSWWYAAANRRREAGDLPGALAALEDAERLSGPALRLAAMRAGAE